MEKAHAEVVGKMFELSDEEVAWLQIVPYKGSIPTAVPTDPLIYRWHEVVNVYGTTIKELIHEEFGDGIMSAIDFSMEIQREPDPKRRPHECGVIREVPFIQDFLVAFA